MVNKIPHDFGIKGRNWSTGIRLPTDLAVAMKQRAHEEYRTFNSLLIAMLVDAYKKPKSEEIHEKVVEMEAKLNLVLSQIAELNAKTGGPKK